MLIAQVGRNDLNNQADAYEEFTIVAEAINPSFNDSTKEYDRMLLKLSGTSSHAFLPIGRFFEPDSRGQSLTLIGFGDYSNNESLPNLLQETVLEYIPNNVCEQEETPDVKYNHLIYPDMLCAVSSNTSGFDTSFCSGNPGGPLVKLGISPVDDVLVGIKSW